MIFSISIQKELSDKRKRAKSDEPVVAVVPVQESHEKKKKRRKGKPLTKGYDAHKIWQSSSASSEADEEIEEEEEIIEEYEPPLEFKSDHEFSPESDIGSDSEYQPMKRARTARKNKGTFLTNEECRICNKLLFQSLIEKKNFPAKNVESLIIQNGYYFVINVIMVGIVLAYGRLF